MSQTFTCPKCGAPQDYQGGSAPTIQCAYCETTLIVPETLRSAAPDASAFDANQWTRDAEQLIEIKRLLGAGKKIEAIKLYRETFGTGLKEAKDAVEAIGRGQNIQVAQITFGAPQSINLRQGGSGVTLTPTPSGVKITRGQNKGCITWIIVLFVLAIIATIIVPILWSVGAFALFMPVSNDSSKIVTALTSVPRASAAPRATETARPSPTPQFARVVSEFGGKGAGAGKMEDARAIAVDNKGNVFVAEYLGGRIQIFDANGKFKTQCLLDAKMPLPALAADRSGNLFALQGAAITQYDATTCAVRNVFQPTLGESYESIAMGADGMLYATLTGNNRDGIVRLNPSGLETIVTENAISGQLDSFELEPILALDGAGNFYVLGVFADQVFKFDRNGKFVDTLGSKGSEPGQFSAADTLAIDSQGRIYVSDSKGVQVFANDGRYLDVFDIPESVASGMAFDDQDNLWIAARERVYQLKIRE